MGKTPRRSATAASLRLAQVEGRTLEVSFASTRQKQTPPRINQHWPWAFPFQSPKSSQSISPSLHVHPPPSTLPPRTRPPFFLRTPSPPISSLSILIPPSPKPTTFFRPPVTKKGILSFNISPATIRFFLPPPSLVARQSPAHLFGFARCIPPRFSRHPFPPRLTDSRAALPSRFLGPPAHEPPPDAPLGPKEVPFSPPTPGIDTSERPVYHFYFRLWRRNNPWVPRTSISAQAPPFSPHCVLLHLIRSA